MHKRKLQSSNTKAFTLVELAVVIVLLGLIISGIVVGHELIKQAKLRSVVTDFEKYVVSFRSFKFKYGNIPGDMSTAYTYWGAACDATPSNCNGDNNKRVDGNQEWARFWQHLALAEMIPGTYTGTAASPIKSFLPAGPLNAASTSTRTSGSVYSVKYEATAYFQKAATALALVANGDYDNGSMWDGTDLSPGEAKSVDLKIDDGIANNGILYAIDGQNTSAGSCSGAFAGAGADYALSSTLRTCWLARFVFE